MAIVGQLAKSGLFGPLGFLAYAFPGAGYTVSKKIAETGQKHGLKEYGVSELFGGYQPVKTAYAAELPQQTPMPPYTPLPTSSSGQVLGKQTSNEVPVSTPLPPQQQLGGGEPTGPSIRDIIEQEYQQVQSYLGGLEEQSRQQAEGAKQQVLREYGALETELPKERALREKELESARQQTGLDVQQATTRIKQMLSDLQNRNMAFLASRGGGAFASSLGAAVGERLGRIAQQQIGGLEAERVNALNAINVEAERVKQFFDKKLTDIQLAKQRALENIQSQLEAKLGQIASFKYESARAKATEYLDAWREYINSRRMLQTQAFNAFQELQNWALEKGQTLEQARNFALRSIPQINPRAFGIVPPTQPLGTGLGEQPFTLPIPQSGVQVSVSGGTKDEDELSKQLGVLPSTVTANV